jgi:GNAT superfamily N-acetyltransferase
MSADGHLAAMHLRDANGVEADDLDAFLARFYPTDKVAFLRQHGAWWHQGNQNRLVAVEEGRIAGYCAVIPTRCLVGGRVHDAVWWVDLIVAPEFRGRGIQRLFDERVREMPALKLGFPNRDAAVIHRKHGWGVREDLAVGLLPLRPSRVRAVRLARGGRRAAFTALRPALALAGVGLRGSVRRWRPAAWRWEEPQAAELAAVFEAHTPTGVVTTARDAGYLRWRYLEAPHRDQLRFFASGPREHPEVVVVSRVIPAAWGGEARIVDVFGDLDAAEGLTGCLRLAVQDALREGAAQATILTSQAGTRAAARRAGFLVWGIARFCWYGGERGVREALDSCNHHWVMADSDNDDASSI